MVWHELIAMLMFFPVKRKNKSLLIEDSKVCEKVLLALEMTLKIQTKHFKIYFSLKNTRGYITLCIMYIVYVSCRECLTGCLFWRFFFLWNMHIYIIMATLMVICMQILHRKLWDVQKNILHWEKLPMLRYLVIKYAMIMNLYLLFKGNLK